jgi:hypothetical protein
MGWCSGRARSSGLVGRGRRRLAELLEGSIDDHLHALGDEPHDGVDDALLVPAIAPSMTVPMVVGVAVLLAMTMVVPLALLVSVRVIVAATAAAVPLRSAAAVTVRAAAAVTLRAAAAVPLRAAAAVPMPEQRPQERPATVPMPVAAAAATLVMMSVHGMPPPQGPEG